MKTLTFFLLSTVLSGAFGCLFNGIEYGVGDHIPETCFNLVCEFNGTHTVWGTGAPFRKTCAECRVSNDPHFNTFDSYAHHWHGKCNYTISQFLEGSAPWGYNPAYGIYGDFRQCGIATCLNTTTYKANEFIAIKIVHSQIQNQIIYINNNQVSVPLLPLDIIPYQIIAWYTSGYIYLQGPDFSMRVSNDIMYIWTTSSHLNKLGGLCGYYSNKTPDEHTGRDGTIHTPTSHPVAFPQSWKTNQENADSTVPVLKKCVYTAEDTNLCKSALTTFSLDEARLSILLTDCLEDLCRDPKNTTKWLANIGDVAEAEKLNDQLANIRPVVQVENATYKLDPDMTSRTPITTTRMPINPEGPSAEAEKLNDQLAADSDIRTPTTIRIPRRPQNTQRSQDPCALHNFYRNVHNQQRCRSKKQRS